MAVFASADPIVGFHTNADRRRSYAAVATSTTVVSAIQGDCVRRQIATSNSASAPEWSIAWPIPPA